MDYIDYPALIEEREQNLDAYDYEKQSNKDVKISTKKKTDRKDKTKYWPTSIEESLNWLPFLISWSSLQIVQRVIEFLP